MNETNSAVIARLDRATQYSRDGRVQSRSRGDRDRGEPRGSSPPTPPYIRVRIRRFDGLSTVGVSRRAGESDSGVRRNGFGPFERRIRASPFLIATKASDLDIRPHGPVRGLHVQASFHRSGLQRNSFRLLRPLLTSALRSGRLTANLSLVAETQHRSPEVRSTAFAARPSDLPPRPLMAMDFAISSSLVRPGRPLYPLLVHRAAALLHASFRPRLATTPLRFANPSPPSGWIEDFHLQAVDHARHTTGSPGQAGR